MGVGFECGVGGDEGIEVEADAASAFSRRAAAAAAASANPTKGLNTAAAAGTVERVGAGDA